MAFPNTSVIVHKVYKDIVIKNPIEGCAIVEERRLSVLPYRKLHATSAEKCEWTQLLQKSTKKLFFQSNKSKIKKKFIK